MSILFVSTCSSSRGGSEQLWKGAARDLASDGHDVKAMWTSIRCPPAREFGNSGVSIVSWRYGPRYLNWRLQRHGIRLRRPGSHVQRVIEKHAPDLVVFCQAGCFSAYREMNECREAGIRYCCVSQLNTEHIWPNDNNYQDISNAFHGAEATFFVSHGNAELFQRQIASRLSNAVVVGNPLPVVPANSVAWPKYDIASDDRLAIACVARVEFFQKGIDLLLQVFAKDVWATRNFQLNVFGDGQLKLAKKLAQHLGTHRVHFHGHIDSSSIWCTNHVLVLPSRYEGMPLAMLEAMYFGRPVVAVDVAGHSEVVTDGESGFLASAATVEELSAALERMWENRSQLQQMGHLAQKHLADTLPSDPVEEFARHVERLL